LLQSATLPATGQVTTIRARPPVARSRSHLCSCRRGVLEGSGRLQRCTPILPEKLVLEVEAARLAYHETAGAQRGSILSNSSASGEWLLEDLCIVCESDKEPMSRTNALISSTFLKVSFSTSPSCWDQWRCRTSAGCRRFGTTKITTGSSSGPSSPRTVPS
jgi:hypothetical protein